jgi:hypothetical protein
MFCHYHINNKLKPVQSRFLSKYTEPEKKINFKDNQLPKKLPFSFRVKETIQRGKSQKELKEERLKEESK